MRLNAIAGVLAVNIVLAGGLAYLWSDADRTRWSEPAPLPPALEDVAAAQVAEPTDVARYRETIERPLFAANRKPAPRRDQAGEAEAAADALKDVQLLGTYAVGDRGGIIILRGGKVERVAIGESLGGWKVASGSQGRSAELTRADGQRRQLELALNNTTQAAADAGKNDAQGAGQAAAGEPQAARAAPAAAQRASSRGARSGWGGQSTSPEAQQQRIDRINQRRAARGQPPLPQNR